MLKELSGTVNSFVIMRMYNQASGINASRRQEIFLVRKKPCHPPP